MRFTVLGHAALLVEHEGRSILFDPWLVGSCYWRSWWNYPELDQETLSSLKPDFIYVTHLHWDHFHGPSLRKFDKKTKLLVPKIHTRRMVEDLRWLGFEDVTEVPPGGRVELGQGPRGLALRSYQFGIGSDSAVVLTGGRTTLFNANDCKLFGGPLERIIRSCDGIDFVFRSYSSASAIPYCIEGYETKYPQLRKPESYIQEFGQFALHVGARYGIPFASNHCFLHQDTRRFNETTVSPKAAADHLNARAEALGLPTRGVVMPPGSSWSEEDGFRIREFDYEKRAEYIAALEEKNRARLEESYAHDKTVRADFAAFENYMQRFLHAIPRWIPRIADLKVTFEVIEAGGPLYWVVDFRRAAIERIAVPPRSSLVMTIDAAILNDCTRKWMFSTLGPSKRIRFRLPEKGTWIDVRLLLSLLDLYELELLPLRRHLGLRHLSIWVRRWPELTELIKLIVRHRLGGKPFRVIDLYPAPTDRTSQTDRTS